jgi:ribokinase
MSRGMKRVVVVGSLNADLVVRMGRFPAAGETVTGSDFAVYPGGKGANQACAAAKLGAQVFMVGRVGDDANGRLLRESLEATGADVRHVQPDAQAPTGIALIEIDAKGQNRIVVVAGANARLLPAEVDAASDLLDEDAVLLVQLEVPLPTVEHALGLARARGTSIILDPAPAGTETTRLVDLADYVTPNETELGALVGEVPARTLDEARGQAHRLLGRGARTIVAKRGAEGALLVARDIEHFWPAPRVTAVDSTAAGDAWNGAFAAALAEGRAVAEAGLLATEAAALSVTRPGAQPSMPTHQELQAWRAAPARAEEKPQ